MPESRINCRQHFFAVRVIKVWNSLPDDVVAADRLSMYICRPKNTQICLNLYLVKLNRVASTCKER